MSLAYKLVDHIARKKDIKHYFDMPEEKFKEYLKTNERPSDVPEFIYKRLNVTKLTIGGRPVFRLTRRGGVNGRAILFLHGGGGMFAPTVFHYKLAAKLAEKTRAELFFPFYPLAPEATSDESAEWISNLYRVMLSEYDPAAITVIGDSAGALLTARVVSLAERKPRGAVLISPVTGIDRKDEASMAARRNDILLSEFTVKMTGKYWGRNIPLSDPRMNAEYIDYTGFPQTLLYYGTNEMFAPHMDRLIEKIKNGGAPLEVHVGEGMCHDWAIISFLPEGRKAFKRMSEFVNE